MSKLWMAFLPAIFSFGPMFMTNMGSHGTSPSDFVMSFGAAFNGRDGAAKYVCPYAETRSANQRDAIADR